MWYRMASFLSWSPRSFLMETMTWSVASTSLRRYIYWEMQRSLTRFWSSCASGKRVLCPASSCPAGPRFVVQVSVRPPRVPGGDAAETQHGHARSLLPHQVQRGGNRHGNCHRSAPHRAPCCPRSEVTGLAQTLISMTCQIWRKNSHFDDHKVVICVFMFLFFPQEWHSCQAASLKRRPAWTSTPSTPAPSLSPGPWLSPTAAPCRPPPWSRGKESWATRRPPPRSSSNALRSDKTYKQVTSSSLLRINQNGSIRLSDAFFNHFLCLNFESFE